MEKKIPYRFEDLEEGDIVVDCNGFKEKVIKIENKFPFNFETNSSLYTKNGVSFFGNKNEFIIKYIIKSKHGN